MAIARCEKCGKPTQNVKPPGYSNEPYRPVGYPDSGIVCGKPECDNTGLIWLKVDEAQKYHHGGIRVFQFATHTAKVRLQ